MMFCMSSIGHPTKVVAYEALPVHTTALVVEYESTLTAQVVALVLEILPKEAHIDKTSLIRMAQA